MKSTRVFRKEVLQFEEDGSVSVQEYPEQHLKGRCLMMSDARVYQVGHMYWTRREVNGDGVDFIYKTLQRDINAERVEGSKDE